MDINQLWADEMNGKIPSGTYRTQLNSILQDIRDEVDDRDVKITRLEQQLRETEAKCQEHSLCGEVRDGLLADNTRLRECLKRLEWCDDGACAVCMNLRSRGHQKDCWLAAELKERE